MQQTTTSPTESTSPRVSTVSGWPNLVARGLGLLTLLAIVSQVVNEVVVPPLIISAVVLAAAGVFAFRKRSRKLMITSAVLAAVFLALTAPFMIGDLAHPESFAGFVVSVLLLIVALMTIVAGLGGWFGWHQTAIRKVAAATAVLAVAAIVPAAIAAQAVEDDTRLATDVVVIASDGLFTESVEVETGGALFIENSDAYRHTLVIENTGTDVELPASAGRRLPIDLAPGNYRFFCDVPGHDMDGTLIVTEPTAAGSADSPASTQEETAMQRTPINPWPWSVELGFNQGELVDGHTRELFLSGQSAMNAAGEPQFVGDMAAQIQMSLDNLVAVLAEADMDLSNVVRMNIYTTDVDLLFENYGIIAERLGAAGVMPPGSLLGVTRLAFPELMVELEATAVG